jgi:hypothetical protein
MSMIVKLEYLIRRRKMKNNKSIGNRRKKELDKEITEDKLTFKRDKKKVAKNRRKEILGAIEESILLGIDSEKL